MISLQSISAAAELSSAHEMKSRWHSGSESGVEDLADIKHFFDPAVTPKVTCS